MTEWEKTQQGGSNTRSRIITDQPGGDQTSAHEHAPAFQSQPERKQQPESGALARLFKGTAKWSGRAAGTDVLWRDMRRVKPFYPHIWRQLFSREGLRQLRNRALPRSTQNEHSLVPWAAIRAFLAASATFVGLIYLAHSGFFPSTMPYINKIAVAATVVMTGFSAMIYMIISAMQFYRRLDQHRLSATNKEDNAE